MPTLRLAPHVQCRQAAESALQDGDEGGFEFQNMLASEITASWLTEGSHKKSAKQHNGHIVTYCHVLAVISSRAGGEDRGARGEIRLPAALAGSQKRGARAGEREPERVLGECLQCQGGPGPFFRSLRV